MDTIKQSKKQQEAKRLQSRISAFISGFQIGTALNQSGIRKIKGATPLALFMAIFLLPFEGNNFFQGIVKNESLPFKKDSAYDFLKNPCHNWRKFMQIVVVKVFVFINRLTDENRERVFIFDDSTYDRSRSKMVELLAWIFDHNTGKHLKGFKLLTLGWSDGASFLPLDFILCSSAKSSKRVQEIKEEVDKRTSSYKRKMEAITKSTDHLESMVQRALALGIKADYILMDSWFSFPAILAKLGQHLPVICMAKNMPKVFYNHDGKWLTLGSVYAKLKKRPGKAKIIASTIVKTKLDQEVKIVFVRHRQKKRAWLAVLSTKTDLPDEEIIRIYGKRWDIEVFFKMAKHHLNLEKEAQLRSYDGMIGHITIVMVRYIFLAYEQRCHDDPKTIGDLFFACSDEMDDLSLVEALQRLLTLVMDEIRSAGNFAEATILDMTDSIMATAIDFIKPGQRLLGNNIVNSAC
jgi:hypothetical protein